MSKSVKYLPPKMKCYRTNWAVAASDIMANHPLFHSLQIEDMRGLSRFAIHCDQVTFHLISHKVTAIQLVHFVETETDKGLQKVGCWNDSSLGNLCAILTAMKLYKLQFSTVRVENILLRITMYLLLTTDISMIDCVNLIIDLHQDTFKLNPGELIK